MKENFLAVFDGTDECKSAVRYAARRAKINNAGLLIVATVDTAEFTYWLSVNNKMIDDIEKESREALEELSISIKSYSDITCNYIIEHGSKLEAVKNLISLDNSISLLILASNKKDNVYEVNKNKIKLFYCINSIFKQYMLIYVYEL